MSNEEKNYSREQKAGIVLEVIAAETDDPNKVLKSHGVTAAQVLTWARELEIDPEKVALLIEMTGGEGDSVNDSRDDSDIIELESDDEQFLTEVEYGASFDYLNYKRLVFWSLFGIGFILMASLALHLIYNYSTETTKQRAAEQGVYFDSEEIKLRDENRLATFGIVDYEAGVYRVPVDSIIGQMSHE